MGKIRIYKVAEQLGMPTHDVMEVLKDLGAEVKNHMSSIEDDLIDLVKEELELQKQQAEELRKRKERTLLLENVPTIREISKLLNVGFEELAIRLVDWNIVFDSKKPLPPLVVEKLARTYGWEVEWKEGLKEKTLELLETKNSPRPPIVTILGHVDHGKTTLLDAIRQSRVAESEFGGITQKIGAYQVELAGRKITFIDTPGHEAFTTMRARGAQVTDVAVLVVAADDGVMPQTIEAIQHARAADVPIVVAINKVDKPGANPERVKQQLADQQLIPEEWGGDTIVVNVSALQKKGIEDLLEMILLQADMLELRARVDSYATGVVIESRLDRGRGPVATVIVQEGTLKVGDFFVVGNTWGKVRSLISDLGQTVKQALPSTPVEVVGFSEVPSAGAKLLVVENEKIARSIAEDRQQKEREKMLESSKPTPYSLEEILSPQGTETKQLNLVVKADFHGSIEALEQALSQLSTDEVSLNFVSKGVGNITEADIMLASASQAIVVGFNVKLLSSAEKLAKQEGVEVRLYRVIYDLMEDIEKAITGMVEPQKVEETIGKAEVRAIFKIPRVGIIAGCYVTQGKIDRNAWVRVIRNEEMIKDKVKIVSLKHFKEDVREISQGYECGIGLDHFDELEEGDVLEAYVIREQK
ncbi:MAG: translation initiation factor [Candidatus Atribacteria bacterium]|nr:translation initiation factor [Candidatus Atribacteria bacterium]